MPPKKYPKRTRDYTELATTKSQKEIKRSGEKAVTQIPATSHSSIARVSTGIPGLDELMEGGFVKGSTILVAGGTGSGKTTFCAQFINDGLKKGESGVYISLEESPDDIRKDIERYGFKFEKFESDGRFKLVYQNPFEVSDITSTVVDLINSVDAKRVVIDPVSIIGMYIKDPAVLRKRIFEIIRLLKKTGTTVLLTSEIEENSKTLSREGVVEFVVDCIVVLNYLGIGEVSTRTLLIRKARRTKHGMDVYPLEITTKGLTLSKPTYFGQKDTK